MIAFVADVERAFANAAEGLAADVERAFAIAAEGLVPFVELEELPDDVYPCDLVLSNNSDLRDALEYWVL